VVSFFGEIKHYKGLDILIDAASLVAKKNPNLFILIAGKPGSKNDTPNVTSLRENNVAYKMVLGFIPNDDVWKYYIAADVIALPYRKISQSGVLFSALAHERAVICSAVGCLPEIIDSTKGGITVEAENVVALAEAISDSLQGKMDTRQQGIEAAGMIEKIYGWPVIARKTTDLYQTLILAD